MLHDVEDGINLATGVKYKVIEKLMNEFGFDFSGCTFDILTFKGKQDADAFRWFTNGLHPQINSRLTMTDFVRNKKAVYDYNSYGIDGVLIDEGNQHPKRWEEPEFRSYKSF